MNLSGLGSGPACRSALWCRRRCGTRGLCRWRSTQVKLPFSSPRAGGIQKATSYPRSRGIGFGTDDGLRLSPNARRSAQTLARIVSQLRMRYGMPKMGVAADYVHYFDGTRKTAACLGSFRAIRCDFPNARGPAARSGRSSSQYALNRPWRAGGRRSRFATVDLSKKARPPPMSAR